MTARTHQGARSRRAIAILCTFIALAAGTPAAAQADDFWGLWASEVVQRSWWEMPFTIAFSFPAMLVTTPFWAGNMAVGAVKNRGDGDDAGDEDDY